MKNCQDRPGVWAHRGGRSLAAENTLLAVKKGYEAGADGWETDVVLTGDGVPVLLHDLNLLRTTNGMCHDFVRNNFPPLPWRFSLEEIKKLNAGIFPSRKCGNEVGQKVREAGPVGPENSDMAVPTLAEALRLSAELGLFVNVEIKDVSKAMPATLSETIVTKVLEVIKAEKMEEQVLVSSFNHQYLVESKKLKPHIPTGALTPHNFSGNPVTLIEKIGAEAWHPGFRELTAEKMRMAVDAGISVNPYTVNEREDARRLVQWGATNLITDFPQEIENWLAME